MNNYEELLTEAIDSGLIVKEKNLLSADGRIFGKRIAIRENIVTLAEKACVLAEELGHHYTSTGNIIDLHDAANRKQEQRARLWAYNRQIGLRGLIAAYTAGCSNQHEIAEYLNVTEGFLLKAIERYQSKYGIGTMIDQYWITFIPNLQVYEYKKI